MPLTSSKIPTLISPPALHLKVTRDDTPALEFTFKEPFRIGREEECKVCVKDYMVSRVHAEVKFEEGQWWYNDLNSTNGSFLAGERITRVPLASRTEIAFGVNGPVASFSVENAYHKSSESPALSLTHYIEHYFNDARGEGGEHTMMVRRAFQKVQKQKSRGYLGVIALVTVLFLGAAGFALYKHLQLREQQKLAQDLFYQMKELDVTLAGLEKTVAESGDARLQTDIANVRGQRKELEKNYDRFVDALDIYSKSLSPQDSLILRIARLWGECEVNIPEGFVREVRVYIRKWQSTPRLRNALVRAQEFGYAPKIATIMLQHDMPKEFFYLALQESDFDVQRCGPRTRFGIAKGMWQFIPETARRYGLRTGVLLEVEKHDPRDDRHHFEKSTTAAAQYLRDIYNTDAQASGLLVMASYNWGENNVKALIRQMPANPRERNFWKLLENYRDKIPQETYDYVFYIISATVIGENPRLFGFDFERPWEATY